MLDGTLLFTQENIDLLNYKINKEFWHKLIKENLIDSRSPIPNN